MNALVIIDMQRWMFRTPDRLEQLNGMLKCINDVALRFVCARLPIYDIVTIHSEDRSTWSKLMIKYDYSCLIEGTRDAEPVEGYLVPPSATRICKTRNSAFLYTDFEEQLRADGVTKLLLTGVFMDGCVALTAADAAQRQFEVACIKDGIGHVDIAMRQPMEKWLGEMYEIDQIESLDALS